MAEYGGVWRSVAEFGRVCQSLAEFGKVWQAAVMIRSWQAVLSLYDTALSVTVQITRRTINKLGLSSAKLTLSLAGLILNIYLRGHLPLRLSFIEVLFNQDLSSCFINCFELYLRIYRKVLLISRIKLH